MWIIADERLPLEAKISLQGIGELIEFPKVQGVYPPIASHPDIFMAQYNGQYVIAPNTPLSIQQYFQKKQESFARGKRVIGQTHPATAGYNVVTTKNSLLCHPQLTEEMLLAPYREKEIIPVRQAYTRCSTIALKEDCFISSDPHIYQSLLQHNKKALKLTTEGILLPGLPYGLFGGCCGMHKGHLYIIGSLSHFPEGERCRAFLDQHHIPYTELYNGPLFDGGGIFFE